MDELIYAYEAKPVTKETADLIAEIRAKFSDLEKAIYTANTPKAERYFRIAKTHLETACMFAIKSFTHPEG